MRQSWQISRNPSRWFKSRKDAVFLPLAINRCPLSFDMISGHRIHPKTFGGQTLLCQIIQSQFKGQPLLIPPSLEHSWYPPSPGVSCPLRIHAFAELSTLTKQFVGGRSHQMQYCGVLAWRTMCSGNGQPTVSQPDCLRREWALFTTHATY